MPGLHWDIEHGQLRIVNPYLGYERPATPVEAMLIRELDELYRQTEQRRDMEWQLKHCREMPRT